MLETRFIILSERLLLANQLKGKRKSKMDFPLKTPMEFIYRHGDIIICMHSLERQLIVYANRSEHWPMKCAKVPGRRRKALLSVDTPIIACLANLLPGDVPDIIGCLCTRRERDALSLEDFQLKRLKSIQPGWQYIGCWRIPRKKSVSLCQENALVIIASDQFLQFILNALGARARARGRNL